MGQCLRGGISKALFIVSRIKTKKIVPESMAYFLYLGLSLLCRGTITMQGSIIIVHQKFNDNAIYKMSPQSFIFFHNGASAITGLSSSVCGRGVSAPSSHQCRQYTYTLLVGLEASVRYQMLAERVLFTEYTHLYKAHHSHIPPIMGPE